MLKRWVWVVYAGGCLVWPLIWSLLDGYEASRGERLLWFPYFGCYTILVANLVIWLKWGDVKTFDVEVELIRFVEQNAAHLITGIAGTLVVAAAVAAIRQDHISIVFLEFQAGAFACAVVGVLPIYWIPVAPGLARLRHFKTVPFSYAVSLFLGALIILINSLFDKGAA